MVSVFVPKSLKEALEYMAFTDCVVFAGGTDLMVRKKQWAGLSPNFDKPVLLISDLQELKEINEEEGFLIIGAGCSFTDLMNNRLVPDFYKGVFKEIASPAVRNAATLGGNICNSSPAGDSLPLLYALDAVLVIENSCRRQELPIEEFVAAPGKNNLKPGELLRAVKIPIRYFDRAVYRKIGTRKATALAKASIAALAAYEGCMLKDIRIAFGSVAPTIVRSRDLEQEILEMSSKEGIDIKQLISDYESLIKPIDDQRSTAFYRKAVCKRLLEEFLTSCIDEGRVRKAR